MEEDRGHREQDERDLTRQQTDQHGQAEADPVLVVERPQTGHHGQQPDPIVDLEVVPDQEAVLRPIGDEEGDQQERRDVGESASPPESVEQPEQDRRRDEAQHAKGRVQGKPRDAMEHARQPWTHESLAVGALDPCIDAGGRFRHLDVLREVPVAVRLLPMRDRAVDEDRCRP